MCSPVSSQGTKQSQRSILALCKLLCLRAVATLSLAMTRGFSFFITRKYPYLVIGVDGYVNHLHICKTPKNTEGIVILVIGVVGDINHLHICKTPKNTEGIVILVIGVIPLNQSVYETDIFARLFICLCFYRR